MDSKYLVRTVTGIAALLIAALVFSLLVCRQESFLGSSFKDMDAYELDIRRMSGTDCHMSLRRATRSVLISIRKAARCVLRSKRLTGRPCIPAQEGTPPRLP